MEEKWFERILIVAGIVGFLVLLFASVAYASTFVQVFNGGTGTSTTPGYGKILVGGLNGEYEFAATSSFGGGGSVSSVSNSDGTLTISPTTGAVIASIALAHANSWAGLQQFANASTTLGTLSTAWFPNITSALLLDDANGKAGAYSGTACTNQFVRSLNGAGVATCNGVSLSADVVGTLGISNGGTNATSFTNGMMIAYNGTSLISTSTVLGGYFIATSTIASQLQNASTTNLSVNGNEVSGERYLTLWDSTTTAWTATSSNGRAIAPFKGSLASTQCSTATSSTDTTGAYTLNVQMKINGTNVTPMFNASTTKGTVTFTSGNTFNKGDLIELDAGTPANSPTFITCTSIATGY